MSADLAYQLRELQSKHAEALASLQLKEQELASARELIEATNELYSQDVQRAKIIELAKKNRTLTLALEKEKQRTAKLQAELTSAPHTSATSTTGLNPEAVENVARGLIEQAAEAAEAAARDAAMWKERMQQQTNKISQLEQKAFSLEIENKKLQRALVREVGEEVPLAKVLDEGSDWKGRREQLIALRDQVKQLKAAQGQAVESIQDAGAKKALQKITKERTQELERATADLLSSRQELEQLKSKYEGAVSRRKILEMELSGLKDKVAVVLEKSQNDDKLINALRSEVAALKRAQQAQQLPSVGTKAVFKSPGAGLSKDGASEDEIWKEVSLLRRRCQEQEEQVDRQEQIILALQQQLQQQQSTPPQGSRDSQAVLEQQLRLAEVENGRLQELVKVLQGKTV